MHDQGLIDWKELQTIVPYSRQHLARLEQMEPPRFPRRVKVGQHRIGWFRAEVLEWLSNLPRA